jgi:pimeloyl-ACP methyl ester carboxylesterase
VSTRQAYEQVDANPLSPGKPSSETVSLLHYYDLDKLAANQPDQAVLKLHETALANSDRNLLFALAEMSYVAGDHIRRSVKPWDPRDARDFYLGSAVYAYLYLFGQAKNPAPTAYERRFRDACDLYNYGLGLALTLDRKDTNAAVRLQNERRRLPVGEIELQVKDTPLALRASDYEEFLLADRFCVRGLSVRNRDAGVGAPLICVGKVNPEFGLRSCAPATVFLRGPGSLAEVTSGTNVCSLELYSALDTSFVDIGHSQVPLETDLTTYRAYTLNQSYIWSIGRLQFLTPGKQVRSQLILEQPYVPGRVPVVFVHGTFSSPVTWAEMVNSLTADPELRKRYQLWKFIYSSGNPLVVSAAELRDELTATVQKLDPQGKDPALRQMVVIGHSQGGLLTKLTVTDTGDKIWNVISTNRIEDIKMSEDQREHLRHWLFLKPIPSVRRVIFISTPHRGSYLSGSFVRKWGRRLMSLPSKVVSSTSSTLALVNSSSAEEFLNGKVPTSLDSMSPKNPVLLTLADIPVAPSVKAHSIIPVLGDGDYHQGDDGVVAYQSAHVDYVESEFIVRGGHSCQQLPATAREVGRILHEHLAQLDSSSASAGIGPQNTSTLLDSAPSRQPNSGVSN